MTLLLRFFDPWQVGYHFQWQEIFLPFIVVLSVLVILHLLIVMLMPLRWAAIRGEFGRQLAARIDQDLEAAYAPVPADVAETLHQERRQVEKLCAEVDDVANWLSEREQSASGIEGLYGAA